MIDLDAFVAPEPNSGCWLWMGTVSRSGYGSVSVNGEMKLAHRVAYEMQNGPIPASLELDHKCRVRCCVNPAHLEAVSHAENIRRGRTGAHQRAKTHCPKGHEYSIENTMIDQGWRVCRACKAERERQRRRRAKTGY